jgi:CRISPR-associated protein Cmr6
MADHHFRHALDPNRYSANARFALMFQYPGTAASSEHTARHFNRVCQTQVLTRGIYAAAYRRWEACAKAKLGMDAARKPVAGAMRELTLQHRAFVDLSAPSLWESNIALHATFGVPYLPASACKGLAVHFARHLKLGEDHVAGLFENTDSTRKVQFHDAWWKPDSAPWVEGVRKRRKNQPLVREVTTPHHPEFLRTKGQRPATPYDSPKPIPQIATHGAFLFLVTGPALWANYALDILQTAMEMEGIGARTPEYGRIAIKG